MMHVLCVCGARPNFMKIASIMEAIGHVEGVRCTLVHTGQHYDERMSQLFFEQLGIPRPDINLEVGSASHAVQTAEVMRRFEPVCLEHKPDWVVVVGDVNSTIACALVAVKLGVRVAHVEAGLRSFDRAMPEEVNRVLTDAISDALYVTEPSGVENLRDEGIAEDKIHFVGNVMVDTLLRHKERSRTSTVLEDMGVIAGTYGVLTLHRPSNVDDPGVLSGILQALEVIGADMPIVFAVHPRTQNNLKRSGLSERLERVPQIRLIEPLGYLDFLRLMAKARVVMTDSGGMQEETTILGVPCLTLRENTERPITIEEGTNRLVGHKPDAIINAYNNLKHDPPYGTIPDLWDGRAGERIVAHLVGHTMTLETRGLDTGN